MKNEEFEKKVKEILKKEGKEFPNQKKIFEDATAKIKGIYKNHYEGFKECWDFALNYYNSSLHLIYGVVIGIFSSIFIQSLYWITNEIVKEEYLLLINILVTGFSGIILLIFGLIFFKEMKQIKNVMKKNEKGMKECKKIISA